MSKYFNIKDFDSVVLKATAMDRNSQVFNSRFNEAATGKQVSYDVFISHSSKNKDLIRKLCQILENEGLSAYIDWEEDAGTSRDEVADKVKEAMDRSKSMLYVKTSESDNSQWVAWEVGRYDHINNDRIGVLLIEDDKLTAETWKHREFLKDYHVLEKDDIKAFVRNGKKKLLEEKGSKLASALKVGSIVAATSTGALSSVAAGAGQSTKYFGSIQSNNDI